MRIQKAIAILTALLCLPSACSQRSSPYNELVRHGYYAYVVPDEVLLEQAWTLQTPFKSESYIWSVHCEGGPSAPENPLSLYYVDASGDGQLSISLSALGFLWNRKNPTETIRLNTPWAEYGEGIVYQNQPKSPIMFEDFLGNMVVVRGKQPILRKIELINQLEYVGPPIEDVMNPWSPEWCENY